MAYYPKYNKNKKTPKAILGAMFDAAGSMKKWQGANRKIRGAEKNIKALKDSERLTYKVPKTFQEMVDQPVDQSFIEASEERGAADYATAMQNLSRDARGALPIVMGLEGKRQEEAFDLLDYQQSAKTAAMEKLGAAEQIAEESDVRMAGDEASGLQKELAAGMKAKTESWDKFNAAALEVGTAFATAGSKSGGMGGEGSFGQFLGTGVAEEGARVEDEEGGTTPDEFDHDSNPIDIVQDGEKIGEMTGEEIIMPPDDRAQIEDLMAKGGGEELVALLQELFSKYDSNVIEGKDQEAPVEEEAPMQEEQEQAPVMNKGGYLAKIKNRLKINF